MIITSQDIRQMYKQSGKAANRRRSSKAGSISNNRRAAVMVQPAPATTISERSSQKDGIKTSDNVAIARGAKEYPKKAIAGSNANRYPKSRALAVVAKAPTQIRAKVRVNADTVVIEAIPKQTASTSEFINGPHKSPMTKI